MEAINIDMYQDEFPVMEPGEYLATVSKVEDYSGQSGNTTLLIQFDTGKGKISSYLGVYSQEEDKRRKALVRFSNIARACGLGGQILPTQLIGRSLFIEVQKNQDQNGRWRNDVGFQFKAAGGQAPQVQAQPQAPSAPQQTTAAPASRLPWEM